MKKFELGQVMMTRGIAEARQSNPTFIVEIDRAFTRFSACDWGDTCEEDAKMNDEALENGDRILAVYKTSKGNVWIITEWDRSVTTILFPDEY